MGIRPALFDRFLPPKSTDLNTGTRMTPQAAQPAHNPRLGIAFVCAGMAFISINDVLIKQLSGGYPLHEVVFIRSLVAIVFSLTVLQFEGGFAALRTKDWALHTLRGLGMVVANMALFAAMAAIPLADATALFFVAPLFITVLSIFFLGEKVGIRRISAVVVGFLGVIIMLRPGSDDLGQAPDRLTLFLPIIGAFAYACVQILTRRLGSKAPAAAMAAYIQIAFIVVSAGFWLVAGDGRFAEGVENKSALFLLRAWVWPTPYDWGMLLFLGLISGLIAYALSQAYRSAEAATVAPFEYIAMPLAILWGWLFFDDIPDVWVYAGSFLIVGSGVYVFVREQQRARAAAGVGKR
jgi:S-adenosylmethionine uptake transporter